MGKGRRDRIVPVAASVMSDIMAWVRSSGRSLRRRSDREAYLFSTRQSPRTTAERVRQLVKALAKNAGIEKPISPHSLRYTVAIETLRAGPVIVQMRPAFSSPHA
jgi:integrase/recombinase XerD